MDYSERRKKVEALLRIKFPFSWAPTPIGWNGRGSEPSVRERHAARMASVEAMRSELMLKPANELEDLLSEARDAEQARVDIKARLEEEGRFFSAPSAAADFEYWAKAEYWTLDESLALLLGKAPEVVTWEAVKPYLQVSKFAEQYERLRILALRAQAMNRGKATVYPSAVLAWATDMDIPAPQGLLAAMAERQAKMRTTASPESLETPTATAPQISDSQAPRKWRDAVFPFLVEQQRAGRHATAKEFFRALENGAGSPESPFDKGDGTHRGSLFVREFRRTVALKTIQNDWQDIKRAAASG